MKTPNRITAIQKKSLKRNRYYVQVNVKKDRYALSRLVRQFLGLLFIIIFLMGCIYFSLALYRFMMTDDAFMVKNIYIENNLTVSEKEILDTVKLYTGQNIFNIDIESCSEQLTQFPNIKSVTITKKLPDTIIIRIYERTPVLQFYSGSYFFVDADGIVLARISSKPDKALPVVKGVLLAEVDFGKPIQDESLYLAIEAVKAYNTSSVRKSLEIKTIDLSNMYDVVLETEDGSRIHLGNKDLMYRFKKLHYILSDLHHHRSLFSEIDLRFENVPIVMRN